MNTKDHLSSIFFSLNPKATPDSSDWLFRAFTSYRHIFDSAVESPRLVIKDLIDMNFHRTVVYPCDVLELRPILERGQVPFRVSCTLFSSRFAEKYLFRYPVFIHVDVAKLGKPIFNLGGALVFNDNIGFAISKITINEPLSAEVKKGIFEIVDSCSPGLDVYVSNHIPGISYYHPKLSMSEKLIKTSSNDGKISLNQTEVGIFDIIKKAKQAAGVSSPFRVAGGWVRDKLLGIESDDIDIAVGIPGTEAAALIKRYADANGLGGIGKPFKTSLEKTVDPSSVPPSDDLMVGGIDINGIKIEFVPMRVESYPDPSSRTPKVALTDNVEEDVIRRDLTINAMYYNIDTGQVEDYVGGMEDLKNMHLRTPVDPKRTFMDDPLRMLRIIRFATKYDGATVDPKAMEAMADPETHQAYTKKVHPNRASKELRKIFGSKKTVNGARMLFETSLYKPVFEIPETWHPISVDQQNPHHSLTLMEHTLEVMSNYNNLTANSNMPEDERMLMNMAAFSHDFLKMHPEIRQSKKDPEGKPIMFQRGDKSLEHMQYIKHDEMGGDFMSEIMKKMGFNNQEREFVSKIVKHHMTPHDFEKQMRPQDMGKFLFDTGELYKHVMEHAHADSLSKGEMTEEDRSGISQSRINDLQKLDNYKKELGPMVNKSIIDGRRMRELALQVDPEMVAGKGAMVKFKDKGLIHYMSYMTEKMLEWQWKKKVTNIKEAEALLIPALKQFSILWRDSTGMPRLDGGNGAPVGTPVLDGKLVNTYVKKHMAGIKPMFMKEIYDYVKMSGVLSPAQVEAKVLEWKNLNLSRYMDQPKASV